MIIVVTGTPGTGKTYTANIIAEYLDLPRLDVNALIEENGLCESYDEDRQCKIVDAEKVNKAVLDMKGDYVIDSHFSHYILPRYVKLCIVTKCSLPVLKQRLSKRKYTEKKIRENMDAEIFDICLTEAEEIGHNILVIDTTYINDEEIIEKVKEKLKWQ